MDTTQPPGTNPGSTRESAGGTDHRTPDRETPGPGSPEPDAADLDVPESDAPESDAPESDAPDVDADLDELIDTLEATDPSQAADLAEAMATILSDQLDRPDPPTEQR